MSEQTEKRGRGRPTKYPLDQIDATPEELARAMFDAAEKPDGATMSKPTKIWPLS